MGWFKNFFDAVNTLNQIKAAVATFLVELLPALFTSSRTLHHVIAGAAVFGTLLGYYFTVSRFAGKGRRRCLRWRTGFVLASFGSLVVLVSNLVILKPAMKKHVPVLEGIREFLVDADLTNITVGIGALLTAYFVVSAVTLNASELWEYRLR